MRLRRRPWWHEIVFALLLGGVGFALQAFRIRPLEDLFFGMAFGSLWLLGGVAVLATLHRLLPALDANGSKVPERIRRWYGSDPWDDRRIFRRVVLFFGISACIVIGGCVVGMKLHWRKAQPEIEAYQHAFAGIEHSLRAKTASRNYDPTEQQRREIAAEVRSLGLCNEVYVVNAGEWLHVEAWIRGYQVKWRFKESHWRISRGSD